MSTDGKEDLYNADSTEEEISRFPGREKGAESAHGVVVD